MTAPFTIRIFDRDALALTDEFDCAVELGRQSEGREAVYSKRRETNRWRVVIAGLEEQAVSRRHALLEPLPGHRVRVSNTSSLIPLFLASGTELGPNTSIELPYPAVLTIGRKTVRVEEVEEDSDHVQGLAEATIAPGRLASAVRMPALELPTKGVEVEAIVRWLQGVMGVLQTAASSSDFFTSAAQAIVDVVGLDAGRVLLLDEGQWRIEAQCSAPDVTVVPDWRPSRQILNRLRQEKRTLWQEPDQSGLGAASLLGVNSVVAAPLLDRLGQIIGVLYGERRQGGSASSVSRIMKIDAMLLELLASGVAAGLARIEQEKAALAARVQFEQFFSPELASELAARPDMLKGRNLEVTLLFCDIRGFSRISERVGPAGTVKWIGDVMGELSDCVLAHRGVLVDYIGDELIAMWGAPKEEPDHAKLACRAALDMIDRLPILNERWEPILKVAMDLGIGVNTGIAQVGNTGTDRKFKYGALGNTVNLASRVQGATKYLKARLLVTGSTFAQLDSSFQGRRLCTVEVVNIAEPVELFELSPQGRTYWPGLHTQYEQALKLFESKDFGGATRILGNLLGEQPDDGPSLLLLSRAVNCLVEEPNPFDPVWKLPGK